MNKYEMTTDINWDSNSQTDVDMFLTHPSLQFQLLPLDVANFAHLPPTLPTTVDHLLTIYAVMMTDNIRS